MRVTTGTIDDFLANLGKDVGKGATLFCNTIYAGMSRRPLDDDDPRKAVRFGVVYQATAVVVLSSGDQYLLVAGEDCGVDYEDSSQERNGSERADELGRTLRTWCDGRGLEVRPGVASE
jgi:hypothetical protein